MEEEIERVNSERVKVLSQLYCNNEEMKRIKSLESMKRLDGVSESESLKEAMKRLNAESKCLNQERDRLKSIYEHLKSIKSSWRKPSKNMKRLDGVSESESFKEAMERQYAESKRLEQEIERLKSIYEPSKKINPTYPRIPGATLDTAKKVMIRSRATFKRNGNKIMSRSVARSTKETSVMTTSVVTSSMRATAINKVYTPVITLEEQMCEMKNPEAEAKADMRNQDSMMFRIADTVADLTLQDDDNDNNNNDD